MGNMEEKTDTKKIETKPTLYRPEYCAKVEEYIGQGHSMESFAHTVNVVRSTIYDWIVASLRDKREQKSYC